jgi:hypothetical protein
MGIGVVAFLLVLNCVAIIFELFEKKYTGIAEWQRDKETKRQEDRKTERQKDRETERQRDRKTEKRKAEKTYMKPKHILKDFFNENAIKPKRGRPPWQFLMKALTRLGILPKIWATLPQNF